MPRLIRHLLPAAAVVVAAQSALAQGVRVKLPAWSEPVMLDSMRQETPINAAPERVYSGVQKAFFDLGLPIGNTDSKSGIIGSERFERTHQIAGAPMSRSFSCGEAANGPVADSYRITIAIVAWVTPGKTGGTTLGLAAAASGTDQSGAYKNPRECASTGRIEQKIIEAVEKYIK